MAELGGLEIVQETIDSAVVPVKGVVLLIWHVWLYEFRGY